MSSVPITPLFLVPRLGPSRSDLASSPLSRGQVISREPLLTFSPFDVFALQQKLPDRLKRIEVRQFGDMKES